MSESPKKRHRPKSLNLDGTKTAATVSTDAVAAAAPAAAIDESPDTSTADVAAGDSNKRAPDLQHTPSTDTASTAAPEPGLSKESIPVISRVSFSNPGAIALRIVSPGLPPLNSEMETTVKISQKIEQQQRHLIASRQSGSSPNSGIPSPGTAPTSGSSASDDADTGSTNSQNSTAAATTAAPPLHTSPSDPPVQKSSTPAADPIQPQTVKHTLHDMDRLSGPTSAKRLRRDNIPTPLTITSGAISGGLGTGDPDEYKPLIQSAPLRQPQRFPLTSSGSQFPHRYAYSSQFPPNAQVYQQNPNYYYQAQPVKRRQYMPLPNTQVTYSSFPPVQIGAQPGPNGNGLGHHPQLLQPLNNPINNSNQHPQAQITQQTAQSSQNIPAASAAPRRIRMFAPFTTTSQYFPGGVRRPLLPAVPPVPTPPTKTNGKPSVIVPATATSNTPVTMQKLPEKKSYSVTDVYHGDYTRAAPISSQPLSAQREFFDIKKKKQSEDREKEDIQEDDDRLPVSEDEIREMQEKYKSQGANIRPQTVSVPASAAGASIQHPTLPPMQPQVLSQPQIYQQVPAHQQAAQQYYQQQYQQQPQSVVAVGAPPSSGNSSIETLKNREIFGSINLMNESIFNFKIFNQGESRKEAEDEEEDPEDSAIEDEQRETKKPANNKPSEENKTGTSNAEEDKDYDKDKDDEKSPDNKGSEDPESVNLQDPTGSPEQRASSSPDWLAKEKEKFLKICETSWDEFVSNRKANSW